METQALGWVRLRVRDAHGREQVLQWDALTTQAALRRAHACGLQVLALETPAAPKPVAVDGKFPLLLLSQELLALLEAGLNLGEALQVLQAKARQPGVRAILAGLLHTLAQGGSFADALQAWPQAFPQVYVATVRAAEGSGDLPRALARYVVYQAQLEAIMKKLVAAALYPALLLVVGAGVSLFLLGYVVPRFAVLYGATGQEMTGATAWLLHLGLLLHDHAMLALALLAGLVGAPVLVLSQARGRVWLRERVLALPGIRGQAEVFRLGRFYRALGLLLASGIALPRAIGMVSELLGPGLQAAVEACRQALAQGLTLSDALNMAGLASPVAHSLVQVGERTGQLAEMLERSARFSDDEFTRWLDWASRLVEPLLMLGIGGGVGGLVVLMYLPVFELAGGLQ